MLDELAQAGILGLLLAISLGGIIYLYQEVKQANENRYEDLHEVWKEDIKFRLELKNLIQNILDILRNKKND